MRGKKIRDKSKIIHQKSASTKKTLILILVILIGLGSFLRVWGFNWGIPQKPYWRPLYQDEAFVIGMLLRMNPQDLNPHYFINPSFHYYTILISIKVAQAFGYAKTFSQPVKLNLYGLPTEKTILKDYREIFIIARLLTVIEGILSLLLVYYIARKLYGQKTGILATAIFSILPTPAFQMHFFVADGPALFWALLALAYLVKVHQRPDIPKTWFVVSGIFLGLALGAKYLNILLIFPFLTIVLLNLRLPKRKLIFNLIITLIIIILVFLITTPHALISWNEFLFGNEEEFGGIFGSAGLLAYNRYPANFFKPFTVGLYYSLRLPLFLLAICSLFFSLYLRRPASSILLSFIVPFYIIMTVSPSPHLRHTLPVLPFFAIMMAHFMTAILNLLKNIYLKYLVVFCLLISLIYTFFYTLCFIQRMTYKDTRIACADWLFNNTLYGTSLGVPTIMPFRYTPPLEWKEYNGNKLAPKDDDLLANPPFAGIKTNYDYEFLKAVAPEYFIITQAEIEEYPYSTFSEFQSRAFVKRLFNEEDYKLIKIFEQDFKILGIKIKPDFPNIDWNPVSPKIYLFKLKY